MKKKTIKTTSMVLAIILIVTSLFSLAGCKKEEPVEDTKTVISVTKEELIPEITDEDLGIVRKDASELSKIVGYQSWEGYNFLVLKNEGGEGSVVSTVQVEDEDLFHSLYGARLSIYLDVNYESVPQDDSMYSAYARGLRTLGASFYELANEEFITQDGEPKAPESTEEAEETEEEQDAEETEAPAEDTDVAAEDELEFVNAGDIADGGLKEKEAVEKEKVTTEQLKAAISEYMQSVSLKRANQILVFALDGELLGELTPAKIDDYVASLETTVEDYNGSEGLVYVSDLSDGVEYNVKGNLTTEGGDFLYNIKNDSRKPVIIYTHSETNSNEEYIFENYMPTDNSTGWTLVENEYSFTSTNETYVVRIEHKNSDTDLTAYLPESRVLVIDDLKKLEKEDDIPSEYSAILNNTDQDILIQADTGDAYTLGSKQAIGVHKSAYTSFKIFAESNNIAE